MKAEAKKEAIEEGAEMAEEYVRQILEGIGLLKKEKEAEKSEQQTSESEG